MSGLTWSKNIFCLSYRNIYIFIICLNMSQTTTHAYVCRRILYMTQFETILQESINFCIPQQLNLPYRSNKTFLHAYQIDLWINIYGKIYILLMIMSACAASTRFDWDIYRRCCCLSANQFYFTSVWKNRTYNNIVLCNHTHTFSLKNTENLHNL